MLVNVDCLYSTHIPTAINYHDNQNNGCLFFCLVGPNKITPIGSPRARHDSIIIRMYSNFRCEHLTFLMRSYGAINLITMFWYTTRRWEAIKCIIPAWIRRFWMTLHVFLRVNYIWGPNVIALASAIAQAPITPLPKNHSKKHSLQQTLDDSIITSWLLLPTILITTQTTHLYHFRFWLVNYNRKRYGGFI